MCVYINSTYKTCHFVTTIMFVSECSYEYIRKSRL